MSSKKSSFTSKLSSAAKRIASADPVALAKQLNDLQSEFAAYGQKAAIASAKFCMKSIDRVPKCAELASLLTGAAASDGLDAPELVAWVSANLDFLLAFLREVGPQIFGMDVMKKWGLSPDDLATVATFKKALSDKADIVCQYGPNVACKAARMLVGVSVTASNIANLAAKPQA